MNGRCVEQISDRLSYVILTCRWCNIIVFNAQAPCEDKGDDVKETFCEDLWLIFGQFHAYDMKFSSDFIAEVDREIFWTDIQAGEFIRNL
jgi:hypothetical protein